MSSLGSQILAHHPKDCQFRSVHPFHRPLTSIALLEKIKEMTHKSSNNWDLNMLYACADNCRALFDATRATSRQYMGHL